jgi:hypothetical protein
MGFQRIRGQIRKSLALVPLLWSMQGQIGLARAQTVSAGSRAHSNQESKPGSSDLDSVHENLNSLAIAPGDFPVIPALVGEKDEKTTFTRELIQVQWRKYDPLDLYVIKPLGVTNPPAVLYLYSYPSETDRFKDDSYCQRVTSGGFAAIGFVSALTGHRYHDRPMKQWFVSEMRESLVTSVHDVQMILNYLATRKDLDMNQIGMFGTGSGGTITILSAAVDHRIKAIDLLNPWGDWPDWMVGSSLIPNEERAQYTTREFLKSIAPYDPVKWLPQLKSQSVRIQRVDDDTETPKICERRLESAARPSVKIVHFDDALALRNAVSGGRLFEWIKQQFHPAISKQPGNAKS